MSKKQGQSLDIWTIYDHPLDIPDKFVARLWQVSGPTTKATQQFVIGNTLKEVREQLPPGLIRLGPMLGDDPVIVEVWLG